MIDRRTVLLSALALAACGKAVPASTTQMPDSEMLRYLVHGVGNVTPLEPGFVFTRSMTESDPVLWYKADAPSGTQREDCYLVTRGALTFPIRTFDYAPFFQYDPAGDGGDCFRISDVFLAAGQRRHGVAAFYTRDGGTPDFNGVWFFGPDCGTPFWLNWLDDVDATERVATPIGGLQQGGTVPSCSPGQNLAGTAYTTYQRRALSVPCWFNGTPVSPTLDCIVSMHFNIAPDDVRGDCERMIFARDLGCIRWEAWAKDDGVRRVSPERAPVIPGLQAPAGGLTLVDCRHSTMLRTLAPPYPIASSFSWPPLELTP